MLFRAGPNLVAMILEMTLYITLQHAMGRKSFTLSTSLDFVIKASTE